MRIVFQSQDNIQSVMRQCGYIFTREEQDELAFVRPLSSSGSGYPRFHAYVKVDDALPRTELGSGAGVSRETQINLHLDQKKPIYRGTTAHSGEYDGELVEREVERIKQILGPMVQR